MFSLLYEYSNLEYVRIYVIDRITQAECVIRILMAASQEYVKTYSACKFTTRESEGTRERHIHKRRRELGLYKIFVYVEPIVHGSPIL